jgi:phospholipase C
MVALKAGVRPRIGLLASAAVVIVVTACTGSPSHGRGATSGIHKIAHVIVIMQENRSFDSYFGSYPGADGIPMSGARFSVCVPTTTGRPCARPYVDHADVNGGGPHGQANAAADIDGGRMDGFVEQAARARKNCADPTDPACANSALPDVMGYHTRSDIPNYWSYAEDYVLQDHMFEPNASWSLPEHLFQVSEWSATCTQHNNPSSCTNALQNPGRPKHAGLPDVAIVSGTGKGSRPIYAWTDLTYLLHKENVSWGYYVVAGTEPDCEDDAALSCTPMKQDAETPASGTRCRTSTPFAQTGRKATSSRSSATTPPRRRARCRR